MTRKARKVSVGGVVYDCPMHIHRIETGCTAGWQIRYSIPGRASLMVSDSKFGGTAAALQFACSTVEGLKILYPMPVQPRLMVDPMKHKQNDLPAGITGPQRRVRKGRATYLTYQVNLPRRGGKPKMTSVYICVESQWTKAREDEALAKAIKLRKAAVAATGLPVKQSCKSLE